jgi:alkanesulfonate monooxygenase
MTSTDRLEIAWFAALCDDDTKLLGVADPDRQSSWAHCAGIVEEAERQGFDSILLPSGYDLGIDNTAFAAAAAVMTDRIRLLLAVRTGELWSPQLARQLATIDEMASGRLDVNIISSPLPGESMDSVARYRRSLEVMEVLDDLLRGEATDRGGSPTALEVRAPRIARDRRRRMPFYFGGLSEPALETAARGADVYLMWPDTLERVASVVKDVTERAEALGRSMTFGYRVHVVVRPTEAEAREAAEHLLSALDPEEGDRLRARALDSGSVGVARQSDLRDLADDDGYVDGTLFTGIGRARSGCGAAIVGDPDQVIAYLEELRHLGISAVILSGYPHREECRRFGELVLSRLDHGPLTFEPPRL